MKILKNYLYNASYQILSLIIPLITAPYVSRVLRAEGIGIYSYTSSINSYFILFATFGLSTYGQRQIAYCLGNVSKQTNTFWEVMIDKCFTTFFATIAYIVLIMFSNTYKVYYAILIVLLFANLLDISWFFQGIQDFKKTVVRNIIVRAIGLASVFIFVKGENALINYMLINVLTSLIGNFSLWLYLPKYLEKISFRTIHPLNNFKVKVELFAPTIAIQIYTVLDKTMIGVITKDVVQNGYYEQASKIEHMVLTLITSLGIVIMPNIAEKYAKGDFSAIRTTMSKAYQMISMISCPLACGLIAITSNFVPIFFGTGYEGVNSILINLASLLIIIPLSNIAGSGILTPFNMQNKATLGLLCGSVSNLLLNTILINKYQALGAAVASVIAELIVTITFLIFVRKYLDIRRIILQVVKYLIPSALMGLLVYYAGTFMVAAYGSSLLTLIIQVAIGALFYVLFISFIYHDHKSIIKELHGQ